MSFCFETVINKYDSPFRILAEKYADHYGDWKEISLRFNPLEGIR